MENDLYTIGKMCERLQLPPGWINSAIGELTIVPALKLNDLAYYKLADETRIFELLRDRQAERIKELKRPA